MQIQINAEDFFFTNNTKAIMLNIKTAEITNDNQCHVNIYQFWNKQTVDNTAPATLATAQNSSSLLVSCFGFDRFMFYSLSYLKNGFRHSFTTFQSIHRSSRMFCRHPEVIDVADIYLLILDMVLKSFFI